MALIVPQQGARNFLDAAIVASVFNLNARLFRNDVSPNQASVLADFTEADFDGYTPATAAGWTPAATVDGRGKIQANQNVWTHNGGPVNNQIWGVYFTGGVGELIWAERFPGAPITMQAGSPPLVYIPVFTLVSEFLATT